MDLSSPMPFHCLNGRCTTPPWMKFVLFGAGLCYLVFGLWVNLFPHDYFDHLGIARPNHPMIWNAVGLGAAALGIGFLIAARNPYRHWLLVLFGFLKSSFVLWTAIRAWIDGSIGFSATLFVVFDDLIWWFPLACILWACLQAHLGRPIPGTRPFTLKEAGDAYLLSSGETLTEAANDRTLVLVFLRHFGCTFTRRLLRELEQVKAEADRHGARLVLVHMLQPGGENNYLGGRDHIARIADPMCELYRAFGLGKGGFLELFGPRVWLPAISALIRGCGMGHLAGDGLQLPGAFLFQRGEIIAAQRARSQADLPDLPALFEGLPSPAPVEKVPA